MQARFKFRVYDDGKMVYFGQLVNVGITSPLMQCTGLKDKNGKLIYEGDILKLAEFGKPVEVKHRALGFVLRREPSNTVGYDNDKYIPEDCEVIGNIYENPELLEVSNDH